MLIVLHFVLRKRTEIHERVYDLLASVDSEEIVKEVRSLLYISNILGNYNESQSILKSNILDYQDNVIRPKKEGARRPSVDNELVLGL